MIYSKNIQSIIIDGAKLFSNEVVILSHLESTQDVIMDLEKRYVYMNKKIEDNILNTYFNNVAENDYKYYADYTFSFKRLLKSKFLFEQKDFSIDESLYDFFTENNLITFFKYKLDPFIEYNSYEMVKDKCLLRLINTSNGNSLDLKIGRYLTKINTHLNLLTSQKIEEISTKFKVKCEENSEFAYLVGEDLLEGYRSCNYDVYNSSSLWGSCMKDKTSYLKLYTKNTNIIKLAVLKKNGKIQARCLVWKINDIFYYDKIYYYREHQSSLLKDSLIVDGILPITSLSFASIKLDFCDFKKYPYLDTFHILDIETSTIIYMDTDKSYRVLHDQYGEYQEASFNCD